MEDNIIKLSKSYKFEGELISELDVSGAEDLTGEDLIRAERAASNNGSRLIPVPQLDTQVLLYLAVEVTHKPIDFFKRLNLKDTATVKTRIQQVFTMQE